MSAGHEQLQGADELVDQSGFEVVVGLEVHCELKTATKLFCGCANVFGAEPNTNICPVCLGLPGSLPVLNRRAVELAATIGLALHCSVVRSVFHRKNYFYPDMPKDYQISQYDEPINVAGYIELSNGKTVRIERAHIEEDTGKTTHAGGSGRIADAEYALVDYNRAGVPLVEIVSHPDIASSAEAREYVTELRSILVATGASDGRMEEGSLRVDANVRVRRRGETSFGTRCEVKNLNSIRSLGRAIDYEARRQVGVILSGGRVVQETRHFDEASGTTATLRSKEEAYDYRYFPEPDLVPLAPSDADIEAIRATLPMLPAERRARLVDLAGSQSFEQVATVVALGLDDLVHGAIDLGADPRLALARAANEAAADEVAARAIDPEHFAELIELESSGKLSATQAKAVLAELLRESERPSQIAERLGFESLGDDALDAALEAIIAEHQSEWARYREGDDKLSGFFLGQVMRATAGRANGKTVAALLAKRRERS